MSVCRYCRTELEGKNLCPTCGRTTWDSEPESIESPLIALSKVDDRNIRERFVTGPWDRVWGGRKRPGIVRIATYFLGGYPGSGKSTLAFQTMAPIMALEPNRPALYLGNEQEAEELKDMARRFGVDSYADRILVPRVRGGVEYPLSDAVLSCNPCCVIQDSLPGNEGVGLEESTAILENLKDVSKAYEAPAIIINHVNSDGDMAGWMALEHLVGGVFMLEPTHRRDDPWRRFRAMKNRMGPTESIILEMGDVGLFAHKLDCQCHVCEAEGKRKNR
jgi:predicted ATP-dependent serine protease